MKPKIDANRGRLLLSAAILFACRRDGIDGGIGLVAVRERKPFLQILPSPSLSLRRLHPSFGFGFEGDGRRFSVPVPVLESLRDVRGGSDMDDGGRGADDDDDGSKDRRAAAAPGRR